MGDRAAPRTARRRPPGTALRSAAPPLELVFDGWTALLGAAVLLHLLVSPFTKVEEGFPLHAAHDALFHRGHLAAYDHLEFPGVVPRSFLGSLLLAGLSAPLALLSHALGCGKGAAQYAVRAALGVVCVASLARLRAAVQARLGRPAGAAFFALTALQFHLPYYMSRTLPNTFALALVSLACADWLAGGRAARAIALLTFTMVVQRCDVLPLAGLIGLHMLFSGQVRLPRGLAVGLAAGAASLLLTVACDSWFWQRWLWPEGEVLWFNTVLNRSSEWGVSAWHWYWTSALPRALGPALPLALAGALLDRRAAQVVGVAAAYVALYSNLPHKEVRFLFPVLPLLNIGAAAALARIVCRRAASPAARAAHAACCAALAAGFLLTLLMTAASRHNYPGGAALLRLHEAAAGAAAEAAAGAAAEAAAAGERLSVHIDTLPAMTGATRFFERGPPWAYSKVENLEVEELVALNCTYLLSAKPAMPGYTRVTAVEGFTGLDVRLAPREALREALAGRLPMRVRTAPLVHVHRRTPCGEGAC